MAQHRDRNHWISNDKSDRFPVNADFPNPRAVIDHAEQTEIARTYVRFDFFFERVSAVAPGRNLVEQDWFVTDVGQQG